MNGSRWVGSVPDQWIDEVPSIRRLAHLPPIDGKLEALKFADYWLAKSGQSATKKDWRATWRNWIRNARVNGDHETLERMDEARPDPRSFDREAYAKETGWDCWAERDNAIAAVKEKYARAQRWRDMGGLARFQVELRAERLSRLTRDPDYTAERMQQDREALGFEQQRDDQHGDGHAKSQNRPQSHQVIDAQDDLAKRMGDDQWESGDPS